jgi:hypothetical protein
MSNGPHLRPRGFVLRRGGCAAVALFCPLPSTCNGSLHPAVTIRCDAGLNIRATGTFKSFACQGFRAWEAMVA